MDKKTYTVEDFKVNDYAWKIIEESGWWHTYNHGYWDINYSSILSKLIQEAGRYCESFASDLFIDWQQIVENLKDRNYCGGVYLFGFRQHGVDHDSYVLNRYNNNGRTARYEYRSLWRLEISIDADEEEIKMKLGRVF